MRHPGMSTIPCSLMRGGSSKGGVFLDSDLPQDPRLRAATLLAAFGSPDARQVDGVGGADPLTSKAAVVGPSRKPGADLDYTFYQVGIDTPRVSMGGTCGNMLAAVGPFALLRGLLSPPKGESEIVALIHATNTGQVITARFETSDGFPSVEGDCAIAGVPGTSSPIRLDFGACSGSTTGQLFPTGRASDVVHVDGKDVLVSLVDVATPFVFVRGSDIGAIGNEPPAALLNSPQVMRRLEVVRGWAAHRLGLVDDPAAAAAATPNVPRVVMVAAPIAYVTVNGAEVRAETMDVCVRQLAMQKPHKALAVTGSVCTAVAARIPNTVVGECAADSGVAVRLGHPSGITSVNCKVTRTSSGDYRVDAAEIVRTARLIMDGHVLVRDRQVDYIARSLLK